MVAKDRPQPGSRGSGGRPEVAHSHDPTIAAGTPAAWRSWVAALLHYGRRQLAALGLTLTLGFGAGLLALYLFAQLAGEVMEQETEAIDRAVLLWLRQFGSPTLDVAALVVSALGSEGVAVLLVVLVVLFGGQRRWGTVATLVLTTGGAELLNGALKELFQRPRPTPVAVLFPFQAFSFPSGHAMVSASFYLLLAYLGWRILSGWMRFAWSATMATLILLIGLSRLYLGVHFLTDVIAGCTAGFVWTDAVIIGGRLLARWRSPRVGLPPGGEP